MSAFLDTNVIVRHLTGQPAGQAARATAFLASGAAMLLTDLVVAETVYVLESVYDAPRSQTAISIRSLLAMKSVVAVDSPLLLRSVEIYETDNLDYAEAYLVANAESTGVARVASFDRSIDRMTTVERIEP